MTEDQVDELFEDCMDEEDDEGEIEYTRKFISSVWVSNIFLYQKKKLIIEGLIV